MESRIKLKQFTNLFDFVGLLRRDIFKRKLPFIIFNRHKVAIQMLFYSTCLDSVGKNYYLCCPAFEKNEIIYTRNWLINRNGSNQ